MPDSRQGVWEHTERFRRELARLMGRRVPIIMCIERGSQRGRLHVQFAAGEYIPHQLLRRAWKVGHVSIERKFPPAWKHLGKRERCRRAAGYVAKYIGKEMDTDERQFNGRRYSTTVGFAGTRRSFAIGSVGAGVQAAHELCGGPLVEVWSSDTIEDWCGPPVVVVRFGDP